MSDYEVDAILKLIPPVSTTSEEAFLRTGITYTPGDSGDPWGASSQPACLAAWKKRTRKARDLSGDHRSVLRYHSVQISRPDFCPWCYKVSSHTVSVGEISSASVSGGEYNFAQFDWPCVHVRRSTVFFRRVCRISVRIPYSDCGYCR